MDFTKQIPMGSETEYGLAGMTCNNDEFHLITSLFSMLSKKHFTPHIVTLKKRAITAEDVRYVQDTPESLFLTGVYEINSIPVITYERILENGGRIYRDGAHPEACTPICSHAFNLVRYEKAMECIMAQAMQEANQKTGYPFTLIKNNSDISGNAWGWHLNTSASKYVFDNLARQSIGNNKYINAYLLYCIFLPIICGSGTVFFKNTPYPYQISQRANFIHQIRNRDTMGIGRALINTRGAEGERTYTVDSKIYQRFHIICFDANMSEVATFLKVGIINILMRMLENDFIPSYLSDLVIKNPVKAFRNVSRDLSTKQRVIETNRGARSALEIACLGLKGMEEFIGTYYANDIDRQIVTRTKHVLHCLKKDQEALVGVLDWKTKQMLIKKQIEKKGLSWDDPILKLVDLQYHDINKEKSLYYRLQKAGMMERVLTDAQITSAMYNAPTDTCAYFKGLMIKKYKEYLVDAHWHYLDVCTKNKKQRIFMSPFQYRKKDKKEIKKILSNIF